MAEVLDDPVLRRYHEDWGRPGDGGVVAELDGDPVGAAWYRLFTADAPGYGFVDEKTPELSIAVRAAPSTQGDRRDAPARGDGAGAREEGYQTLSLSVAVHNRSRMMYQRVGFEKVGEQGESWTMLVNL